MEGERGADAVLGDAGGGVRPGTFGKFADGRPQQTRALVRLGVVRLALGAVGVAGTAPLGEQHTAVALQDQQDVNVERAQRGPGPVIGFHGKSG